ncbi:GntR family transcriptional regulator [Kallipyga massiliensis]|uniref:GntR family transcriptional regulator n=1 Tax=Kallipyga massiliensis TaxID=1472764 RepID=UPI00056C406C|nr:GntR family transcriptional regulator [Kallipyga massiliensis]
MLKTQIKRQARVANLLTSLYNEILLSEYEDGAEITEAYIANKHGVSRSTVRTALSELIDNGLVIVKPNGRKYIKGITSKYIEDLCQTRSLLECEAARIILERENNDFSILLSIVGNFYSDLQEVNYEKRRKKIAYTNEAFHDQLFLMTDNRPLIQCRQSIEPILSSIIYLNASLDSSFNEQGYYDSHKQIVELLMDKDPNCIDYIRYHVREATFKDILKVIDRHTKAIKKE